jgi:hypothetical protein
MYYDPARRRKSSLDDGNAMFAAQKIVRFRKDAASAAHYPGIGS